MKEKSSIALCATEKQNICHVDNGCSKHMTRDLSKFISLKRDKKGRLTFGDNISSKIIGKGTVREQWLLETRLKKKNVLLVEKLKPNLRSVSQTCDQGKICIFDSKKV